MKRELGKCLHGFIINQTARAIILKECRAIGDIQFNITKGYIEFFDSSGDELNLKFKLEELEKILNLAKKLGY